MQTDYRISMNLKTANGHTTVGCFYMGNDSGFAEKTFQMLSGDDNISESTVLCIELTSLIDELSLPLTIKHCTLDELATNIQVLARELFKHLNLTNPD